MVFDSLALHLESALYCEGHYYQKLNAICNQCKKKIVGKCIVAFGKRYHETHFECNFCHKELLPTSFKGHDQKPFCHGCYIKLYG